MSERCKKVDAFLDMRKDGIEEDTKVILDRIIPIRKKYETAARMGSIATNEINSRAFYDVALRPYFLKGRLSRGSDERVFVPDVNYYNNFINALTNEGAELRMYVRLLQSRPGIEQNDTTVSYSTLEFLSSWISRIQAAHELGVNFATSIVDETQAFESGELLGFSEGNIFDSYAIIDKLKREMLKDNVSDLKVTPFSNQGRLFREPTGISVLKDIYDNIIDEKISVTEQQLSSGAVNLDTLRVVALQKLRAGDIFTSIHANSDFCYLDDFSEEEVHETLAMSESFFAALAMRPYVEDFLQTETSIDRAAYPEYFSDKKIIPAGITKSAGRLSVHACMKQVSGQVHTPGYAIPAYNSKDKFLGLLNYTEVYNRKYDLINADTDLPEGVRQRD